MSDTRIIITTVERGGPTDKNDLMLCYFQSVDGSPDAFSFHDPSGNPIPTRPQFLVYGQNFMFIRGGFLWNVTDFKIDQSCGSGKWNNDDFESSPADDEGTFTAQAGGGVPETAASAAPAARHADSHGAPPPPREQAHPCRAR